MTLRTYKLNDDQIYKFTKLHRIQPHRWLIVQDLRDTWGGFIYTIPEPRFFEDQTVPWFGDREFVPFAKVDDCVRAYLLNSHTKFRADLEPQHAGHAAVEYARPFGGDMSVDDVLMWTGWDDTHLDTPDDFYIAICRALGHPVEP